MHAAGVGNWDEFVRVGDWDVGREPPLALGVEAAGVVSAVGDDVTSLAPGDRVLTHPLPLRHQGAWAEWLVAPAALVARKPAVVPWEVAAAFPVPALTADQALTQAAPVPDGEWVLVHGAGGVTGGLAVQLAVARGATVVATAGPSSAARVRGWGAGRGRLSRSAVAGARAARISRWAWRRGRRERGPRRRGGRAADGRGRRPPGDDHRRSTAARTRVAVVDVYVRPDGARLAGLVAALAEGRLSLQVAATLPLADAGRALQGAVAGRVAGASVLMLQ